MYLSNVAMQSPAVLSVLCTVVSEYAFAHSRTVGEYRAATVAVAVAVAQAM